MSGLRCFVGVSLQADVADALRASQHAIADADARWRDEKWVAQANLHLTLHFIGDVPETGVELLADRVGVAVSEHHAFELPFAHIVASPKPRRARMLWAEFEDPDGSCADLAQDVAAAASALGEDAARRGFRAHVTLCRARQPHAVDDAALADAGAVIRQRSHSMSVPSATLFSSRLTPRGPVYTVIGEWRLRGE